jgi:hypothetical protein
VTVFLTLPDNVLGWVRKAQTDKVMSSILLINTKFPRTNSDVAVEHFTEIGEIKAILQPGTPPTDGLPFL